MADTGFVIAQSAVNDTGKGQKDWSDPGNVTADDGTYATVNINSINESNWLRSSHDFQNKLPIDSVIVGVTVRAQLSGIAGSVQRVIEVQLHNGTIFIGTAKIPNTTIPDSDTNLDFGGSEDTWGATLNLIQIGFSGNPLHVGIRADSDSGLNKIVSADAVWIKLHYLPKANRPGGQPREIGVLSDHGPRVPGRSGDFI